MQKWWWNHITWNMLIKDLVDCSQKSNSKWFTGYLLHHSPLICNITTISTLFYSPLHIAVLNKFCMILWHLLIFVSSRECDLQEVAWSVLFVMFLSPKRTTWQLIHTTWEKKLLENKWTNIMMPPHPEKYKVVY